ncbi:hypothetical protein LPJ59_000528 [Coemansia sp. RSA 2399]|nr:hypothetical protein LPJ59_000528 [Coemansia sp. RSA 2399]KAJ1907860.1 hypothetical protein LPJ81_000472 [Coemansia sp. IMI 209127]
MSYISSDSDVEEVNTATPTAKGKGRRDKAATATARPTPVRPKKVCSTFADDSDDDADFFVVKRPHEEPPASEEVIAEPSREATYLQEASYEAGISSESEDDEALSGLGVYKRKHSDNEEEEESRRRRSRSISLTPPPTGPSSPRPRSPVVRQNAPKVNAAMRIDDNSSSQGSDVLILDSDSELSTLRQRTPRVQRRDTSDISGLDPALQAAVQFDEIGSPPHKTRLDTTGGSSGANHLLDKVQIEFRLKYDDVFIMHEVLATWSQAKWGKVKPHDYKKIRKELSKCIAVVAFVTDTVENAVVAFSNELPVNVMAMDPILMVNRMRIFTTVSIGSLGTKPIHYVDVYPRTVYNREREREAAERAAQAKEQEQALRDLEFARVLRETVVTNNALAQNDVGEAGRSQQQEEEDPTTLGAVRIKIRDKAGKDVLFQATKTATIQAIIDNYKSIAKLDARVNVRLEFDDEALDPRSRVGDTEIEDDDMITAYWN